MRDSATTLAPEISSAELARLVSLLRKEHLSGWHLEIGTAAGGTLKEMMRCYSDRQRPHFVVVDPMTYFPNQFSIVKRNLMSAGLDPDAVDFRISKSWPAFRVAERAGESYSFIFIDGSHKINHVTEDLAWTCLLNPGGLVCLHDYGSAFKGVVAAVDRFLARHPNYRLVDHTETLVAIHKTAPSSRREIGPWDRLRARAIGIVHQIRAGMTARQRR